MKIEYKFDMDSDEASLIRWGRQREFVISLIEKYCTQSQAEEIITEIDELGNLSRERSRILNCIKMVKKINSLIENFGDSEIMLTLQAFESDSINGAITRIEASEDFLDGDVLFHIVGGFNESK